MPRTCVGGLYEGLDGGSRHALQSAQPIAPRGTRVHRTHRLAVAAALAVAASISVVPTAAVAVRADTSTISAGPLRTGWDPNEPSLTPGAVTSGGFGQLFATSLSDPAGDARPGNQVVYA